MFTSKLGLLLWDIDGTILLRKDKNIPSIHLEALGLSNLKNSQSELSGLTDWDVLRSLAVRYKLPTSAAENAFKRLNSLESKRTSQDYERCIGINDNLFDYLSISWTHGILSGNTYERAIAKLEKVNLLRHINREFIFACEENESRTDIAKRAANLIHPKNLRTILIGDTKHDIQAAKSVGFMVVAVAGNSSSIDLLRSESPDLLLESLSVKLNWFEKELQFLHKKKYSKPV